MVTEHERQLNTDNIRARRFFRRKELKRILGRKCARCGSEFNLEFHHVDKNSKSFNISEGIDKPWKDLLIEIEKCQLLCRTCHNEKTHGVPHGGGQSGKKNCKCELCKLRKSEYMKQYSLRRQFLK